MKITGKYKKNEKKATKMGKMKFKVYKRNLKMKELFKVKIENQNQNESSIQIFRKLETNFGFK